MLHMKAGRCVILLAKLRLDYGSTVQNFHRCASFDFNSFSVCVCVELSRGGLNGAMTEFQEKLRQQHEKSMHKELEKLLSTVKGAEAEVRL